MMDNIFVSNESELFNNQDIQNAYIDLYKEMRRYIWGFDVIEALANLEIASYQTCPDLSNIRYQYNQLENMTRSLLKEDIPLRKAFTAFSETLNSGTSTYSALKRVNEVV